MERCSLFNCHAFSASFMRQGFVQSCSDSSGLGLLSWLGLRRVPAVSPQLCRVKPYHFSQPFCMALALPAAAPCSSYKFQPPRFSGFAPLRRQPRRKGGAELYLQSPDITAQLSKQLPFCGSWPCAPGTSAPVAGESSKMLPLLGNSLSSPQRGLPSLPDKLLVSQQLDSCGLCVPTRLCGLIFISSFHLVDLFH